MTGEQYKLEVEKWRAEHEARFRSPSGWLALTGHYWLEPGDNRIGSAADCTVQLPADAANNLSGIVRLNGNRVSIAIESGGPLLVDDKESTKSDLPIDSVVPESDCATKLAVGQRLKLQLVRRAGRFAIRVRDSESELIKKFKGKHWFEISETYRVVARYVPFEQPKSVKITNVKGDVVDSAFAGTLEFELEGKTYRLDAIAEAPDSLFIIFKDLTCGKTLMALGALSMYRCRRTRTRRLCLISTRRIARRAPGRLTHCARCRPSRIICRLRSKLAKELAARFGF